LNSALRNFLISLQQLVEVKQYYKKKKKSFLVKSLFNSIRNALYPFGPFVLAWVCLPSGILFQAVEIMTCNECTCQTLLLAYVSTMLFSLRCFGA